MDHEYHPYYFKQPGEVPFRRDNEALAALFRGVWNAVRKLGSLFADHGEAKPAR